VLRLRKYLLLFEKKSGEYDLSQEFFHELVRQYEWETKFYIVFLSMLYLAKTVLVIVIKEFVTYGLFIIFYRGIFNILLVGLFFLKSWLLKKRIYKLSIVIVFTYGLITTLILSYNHKIDKFDFLEITELCLIFYVFTMMR
jgi:hypothetical protein